MARFIDNHKNRFAVEPTCRALQRAPSTYYAARRRLLSARRVLDEALPEAWREQKVGIRHVHADHFGANGVRKLWRQLRREGAPMARCTFERLMRELGLKGVVRGKTERTTIPARSVDRPQDLVERDFRAPVPNQIWVADLTYPDPDRDTWSGFAYVAFVIYAFSRYIVGWRALTSHWRRLNRHSGHWSQTMDSFICSRQTSGTWTAGCSTSRSVTPGGRPGRGR